MQQIVNRCFCIVKIILSLDPLLVKNPNMKHGKIFISIFKMQMSR